MAIAKEVLAAVTLAAASCQPAPAFDVDVAGAQPIAYEAIRDASGVLGYAESLLGPDLATRYESRVGPGVSYVEPEKVAGAWELPSGTRPDTVAAALKARGALDRASEYREGSLWIADFRPAHGSPVRLLFIDGTNPAWRTRAVPEVRPGPHLYLIAYRLS